MLIVEDKLISEEVMREEFACNLRACRGACCHEGDSGAPLELDELPVLEDIYPSVRPFLTERGRREIEARGLYEFVEETWTFAAPCIDDAACVYMTRTPEGFAACGIELAHRAGKTDFKKPISCELYPIRVERDDTHDFEALNYDRWDICSAACALGRKEAVPVFRFVRSAIVRKWGEEFYEQLEAYYARQQAYEAAADEANVESAPTTRNPQGV